MQIEQIHIVINILIFLFVPLIVASKLRILRGILFHISIMLLFIVIGSGLLFLGMHLLNGNNNLTGIMILLISANFFIGVPVFIYLAHRDSQGTIRENIKTILNLNNNEHIVARKNKILCPILLIPKGSGSHLFIFTGKNGLNI
ncbi:MAG: hypothetical protein CSA09_00425 [Candidatus Contendobacter odensis]|uniref:Uncharacterized protein n=1 Tax=Candidatus Contendibacter odensensis TaxID=1400860 RepID=A0A2G6PFN8_9GAMM|nr:MAG: hypothetical protein CSA09_00425 [Candidatus Contendobacter odensis]